MSEYIDRAAAIEIAEKYGLTNGSVLGRHSGVGECISSEIAALPAADVVPVVHGRWDASGRYTFPSGAAAVRCTNCGCALTESEYHLNNWNYCPVCGAKMDEGADDEV